jgi:hypothetical protein
MSDRPVSHRRSQVGPLQPSDLPIGGLVGAAQLSRRDLLRGVALAAGTLGASGLLAACGDGGGGQGQPPAAGSLRALVGNVQQLSLLTAQSQLPAGRSRFAFGLAADNNRLVEGVAPQVWLARDQTSKALGPYPARWLELTGYDKTRDRSPHSQLTGFYVAEVDLPAPGNWLVVALVEVATQRAAAQGAIPVSQQVLAQVGTKARSGPTPVATSPSATAKVCTRQPPCPLHYLSLDRALTSGKPTVLSFATPLLCPSRMCGPVVDEQLVVFNKLGKARANFIHLEIYPQRDTNKPVPLFTTWGFQSEPWVLVIDRDGVIRARLGEGPVVASEIEAALRPLLP